MKHVPELIPLFRAPKYWDAMKIAGSGKNPEPPKYKHKESPMSTVNSSKVLVPSAYNGMRTIGKWTEPPRISPGGEEVGVWYNRYSLE